MLHEILHKILKDVEEVYPTNPLELADDPEDNRVKIIRIHCVRDEDISDMRVVLWEILDKYDEELLKYDTMVCFSYLNDTLYDVIKKYESEHC